MQKAYIRGVKGKGNEVIAKLEELGGNNNFGFDGENERCLYFIDDFTTIQCVQDNCETADIIIMASNEIFLDDSKQEQNTVNTIKEYDPVMVSDDGKNWYAALYVKENLACYGLEPDESDDNVHTWAFIVPYNMFDFTHWYSNIQYSIV